MSISEFEAYRYRKLMQEFCAEHGPPAHVRDQLEWDYKVDPDKQSVVLYEIRPRFDNPEKKFQIPIFKAVYVKSRELWKIYWMRAI